MASGGGRWGKHTPAPAGRPPGAHAACGAGGSANLSGRHQNRPRKGRQSELQPEVGGVQPARIAALDDVVAGLVARRGKNRQLLSR